MNVVAVEPARTDQDYEALIDLIYDQNAPLLKAQLDPVQLSCEQYNRYLRQTGEALCIRLDGKLAGLCWVEPRGETLFIYGLQVSSTLRGRGIGRKVLQLLRVMYPQMRGLELRVHCSNHGAQRLYLREGFEIVAYDRGTGFYTLRRQSYPSCSDPARGPPHCPGARNLYSRLSSKKSA